MRTNIRPFLRFAAFFLVLALAVALANTCLIQTDTFVALMMDELKNSRDMNSEHRLVLQSIRRMARYMKNYSVLQMDAFILQKKKARTDI